MKVLITGGSGLIGMALTKSLLKKGIDVVHVSRQKNSKAGVKTFVWDYKKNYLEEGALNEVTHIVHLAGAGIADKPWTMARKREIVKSRVLTARLLLNKVEELGLPLEKFISASGIGYYGAISTSKLFDEQSERGDDFVAECCVQWEGQAQKFETICDVAIIRTGIVLAQQEGALEKLESTVRRGFGAPIGSGEQYMPWIHLRDMIGIYEKAITDSSFKGIYNAVASEHVTNKAFMQSLAKALNKKIFLPKIPAFIMKMVFGEMAEILLYGSRVSNEKLRSSNYNFHFEELDSALKDLYQ
ncbi:TIGR01777 family oxidoreductase [Parvicella tangerina]|nr:TIGR01777 family oxidoreductase [Parvicella tangerina]